MFGRRVNIEYSKFSYKHIFRKTHENNNTTRQQNRESNLIPENEVKSTI
jgi:hypothetical protein